VTDDADDADDADGGGWLIETGVRFRAVYVRHRNGWGWQVAGSPRVVGNHPSRAACEAAARLWFREGRR
jgi:hypothetical protein